MGEASTRIGVSHAAYVKLRFQDQEIASIYDPLLMGAPGNLDCEIGENSLLLPASPTAMPAVGKRDGWKPRTW